MKQLLFLFSLWLCCLTAICQEHSYQRFSIPGSEAVSTNSIAHYIQSNFKSDKDKIAAAYDWVIENIAYDKDSMYSINWNRGKEAIITEAMRRRKGVCENFAAIFCDIVTKTGISAYVVTGYTKQNGWIDKSDHTWCAVKLRDDWFLCDPTWDKGQQFHGFDYFLVSPETFIASHIPYDPMWQLLKYTVSHADFNGVKKSWKPGISIFNFGDSIAAFSKMNEPEQIQTTFSRLEKEKNINQLIRNRLAYLHMLIAIDNEESDRNFYNAAVTDLNKANNIFNSYLNFRNNGFTPPTTATQLINLLDSTSLLLENAKRNIGNMNKINPSFQFDPGTLINRISSLDNRLQNEKEFLKNNFEVRKNK
ncbi:MAG: transglutaminase domain-containing protein [Ferruginibacter sp.]